MWFVHLNPLRGRLRLRGREAPETSLVWPPLLKNLRRLAALVGRPPSPEVCALRSVGVA
jgi:hypothetical protein